MRSPENGFRNTWGEGQGGVRMWWQVPKLTCHGQVLAACCWTVSQLWCVGGKLKQCVPNLGRSSARQVCLWQFTPSIWTICRFEESKWLEVNLLGGVSTPPDPNQICERITIQMGGVSWFKLVVYILFSAKRAAYFCKSIAIELGGASRYFSVSGSGVDLILLNSPSGSVVDLILLNSPSRKSRKPLTQAIKTPCSQTLHVVGKEAISRETSFTSRPECTKPSHSQSLANFVANVHLQGTLKARKGILPCHSKKHAFAVAGELIFAALNLQPLCLRLGGSKSLANFRGASEFTFAFAAVPLRPRCVQLCPLFPSQSGSLQASHIQANQPHFPHFSVFSCPHFPHFLRFCSVDTPQTFVFLRWERPFALSTFSAFTPYRVRIAGIENPTERLYFDWPWATGMGGWAGLKRGYSHRG